MRQSFAAIIIACMIGAVLTACASPSQNEAGSSTGKPLFQTVELKDKSKALLYIYRPYRFGSALAAPLIFINNEKIVQLTNRYHIWLTLDPGQYVIETRMNSNWSSGSPDVYQLKVESGRNYFLRVRAETTFNPLLLLIGPPIGTNFPLVQVSDKEALAELNETYYLEPEKKQLP